MLLRWNLKGRVEYVEYRKEEVTSSPCDRDTNVRAGVGCALCKEVKMRETVC